MEYNKVWDFFEEIYCINLDHRTDRWERVQKEFDSVGVLSKVQRFSAIKHPDGRLGLIKSNLEILKIAKEKGLNNVLIFEDDVHFLNDTVGILTKAIEQLGKLDWWLLYLGANTHEPLQPFVRSKPNILVLKNAFATHSVAHSKNTYDFFIRKFEGMEKVEFQDTLDVWFAGNFQRKNLCFVVNPIITTQFDSYSDIEKKVVNYSFIEERFKNNTKNLKF
jgi:GR25 family glycosyltransferase involved in LPS biosynthesis